VSPFNPEILLEKLPAPAPSEVLLSSIVGFVLTLQQSPREIIVAEPSLVMVPPPFALDTVICDISEVVMLGTSPLLHEIKKLESKQMAMPILLICFFIIGIYFSMNYVLRLSFKDKIYIEKKN
jgi:hypothetical protein